MPDDVVIELIDMPHKIIGRFSVKEYGVIPGIPKTEVPEFNLDPPPRTVHIAAQWLQAYLQNRRFAGIKSNVLLKKLKAVIRHNHIMASQRELYAVIPRTNRVAIHE